MRSMLVQSIDSALEQRIGPHGVADKALNAALERAGAALDSLRARHADGGLPLLRLPETHDDLAAIREAGRRLAEDATDIVLLGTGGSSLGGQTLAQLAGHAVPGVGALRAPPRLHFIDNLDPRHLRARCSAKLPHHHDAFRRHLEIRRHRRDADADHRRAVGGEGSKGSTTRIPDIFLGLTEPAKAGKRNGLRDLLAAHHVPMLDHHTGVGGRFSALSNVGPAAGGHARSRYRGGARRRRPSAGAGAGEEAGGAKCRPRSAPRSPWRWPRARARASAC